MRKIELLQVGQTSITQGFTTYAAGIFWKKMSLSEADRALSPIETILGGTWGDLSETPVAISGVSFNNSALSEVNSIADLYLQEFSFYFDFNNQNLYVCIQDYRNFIVNDTVKIGETIGFLSQAQLSDINGVKYPLNTVVGSVSYEPRLNDVSVVDQLNDQKNGIFVYSGLEASIANEDGKYDQIKDDITGNKSELLIANLSDSPEEEIETGFPYKDAAEPDDFISSRSGIVENVDYANPEQPVIKAIDQRANWTQSIGADKMTVAEFSGLPSKYVNDRKTIALGAIDGVLCVPLRADGAGADFDYFMCDTQHGVIQSITAVYFKGELGTGKEDRFLTGGEYSTNLTTGIITVSNVEKGDVWVYGEFSDITETVTQILYLLLTFDGLAYIDSNFNITEVEEVRALDRTDHVYITGKGDELRNVIEKLCADIQVDMFQQGDVLTMRASNTIRLVTEEIPAYQIVQNPPPWDTDRTDTIKTITVNYNQDYRTKLYTTYFDDTNEQTALDNNRKAIDQLFSTNLTLVADVEDIYTEYYDRFIDVPRVVSFKRTTAFLAGLADFVSFPVIRTTLSGDKEIFTNAIYKIIRNNIISDSIEAVFFADSRDIELIAEWDADPAIIYEWSDDANILILEAN